MSSFPIWLKGKRNTLALTRKQYAKKLNMPYNTYRRYEGGLRMPKDSRIINIILNEVCEDDRERDAVLRMLYLKDVPKAKEIPKEVIYETLKKL